jgi:phosphoribosylformylglycinamidine synthase
MSRIAIVQFPGSNCEAETARAVRDAGGAPEIVRWNAPLETWDEFDGFVLPGGFSYEDRVRAGAIAAKHAVLDAIAAAADAGRPVLGLCNGAQILVEAGLVPGIEAGTIEVALAANATPGWTGYICDWVHLVPATTHGMLESFPSARPVPMPVGHGEGRFTASAATLDALEARGQIAWAYAAADGGPAHGFPENPNGALQDIAGLCDRRGIVVAMMPHPERAAWLYQVPEELAGPWGEARRAAAGDRLALAGRGPGLPVYESFVARARRAPVGGAA